MPSTIRPLLVFVFASLVALTTPACAALPNYYGVSEPRVVGARDARDARAYDLGYREGFQLGRDDARRGRPFDYTRHREYRENGHRSRERDDPGARRFRRLYRDGFARGYNDAYRQFARRW